jgi:hypothetical protein
MGLMGRGVRPLVGQTTCFETLPRIGGVYCKSYDNTLLTTSSLLTAYSSYSDGKEESPLFWSDEQ